MIVKVLAALFLLLGCAQSNANPQVRSLAWCESEVTNFPVHEFKMSICEIVQSSEGKGFEVRFYLFQDDFKQALYGDPEAQKIESADAKKYINEHTSLTLNNLLVEPRFQSIQEKKDQVLLTFQVDISPNQKIEKIDLSNRLLIEHFSTQVNMVYFVKPDGEKLVQMLDASRTEAGFSL